MKLISIKQLLPGLVALTMVLSLAGCGDDDGNSSEASDSASITKAQFTARANEICAREKKQVLADVAAYAKEQQVDGSEASAREAFEDAAVEVFLPGLESQRDELQALGIPREDEQALQAFFDSLQEAIDTGDETAAVSSGQLTAIVARSGTLAREYGISACAYG